MHSKPICYAYALAYTTSNPAMVSEHYLKVIWCDDFSTMYDYKIGKCILCITL